MYVGPDRRRALDNKRNLHGHHHDALETDQLLALV
jgi:hypothetical protein